MSSRSSISEGEIAESKTEKATTTPSINVKSSVNRKLRDALSPSPEASQTSLSPTASNDRSRYRSRSPEHEYWASRREKRGRGEESARDSARPDSRRFKVHYEGRSNSRYDDTGRNFRGTDQLRSGRYDNRDDRSGYNQTLRYDERDGQPGHGYKSRYGQDERVVQDGRIRHNDREARDRTRDKRQRTSSHSPSRHDTVNAQNDRNIKPHGSSTAGNEPSRNANDKYDRNGKLKAHFVPQKSSNGVFTTVASQLKSSSVHYEVGSTNLDQITPIAESGSRDPKNMLKSTTKRVSFIHSSDDLSTGTTDTTRVASHTTELSAEERRLRREAIKAKYNAASTAVLIDQNLGQLENPLTPMSPIDRPSPIPSQPASPYSPRTPQLESAAVSPPHIHVSHDTELANHHVTNDIIEDAYERSAFDYDPTVDMEEDRFKGDKFHNSQQVSATSYDELQVDKDKQILLPGSPLGIAEKVPEKKKKVQDDMFASDDEDDMFAPIVPTNKTAAIADANRAVTVPKVKTLDQSLLDNWDDKDGYYRVILGELLEDRYHVLANLGKGVFSGVVRATDTINQRLVAIKIIRNQEAMVKAGMKEIEILQKLADADPEDKKHIIRLERFFTHKGHLCMVFENLSLDLRGVLQKFGRDVGINLKAVRSYAQQMFVALGLLQKCNILHADLKPDNILVTEARNLLKICDLGSAADVADGSEITPYLVSRFYRAPEIMLGMRYDFALDMWSIGCTLFELYTGKILFTGRNNNQMLRCIMECRGKFSLKMLKKGQFSGDHFDDQNLNFISREIDRITNREVVKLMNIVKPTRDLKSRLLAAAGATSGSGALPDAELKELNLFADLLDRCLALNPERRIKPQEALKHPFVFRPAMAFGSGK